MGCSYYDPWCGSASCTTYFSFYAYAKMWAGGRAKANNWYVFYSYLYSFANYFSLYSASGKLYCASQWDPTPYIQPEIYFYKYPSKNLDINLINVGTNAAMNSLRLRVNVSVNAANNISMSPVSPYTSSYVSFRFKIVNYEFTCGAFTRFIVRYARPGIGHYNTTDHTLDTQMIKCVNNDN